MCQVQIQMADRLSVFVDYESVMMDVFYVNRSLSPVVYSSTQKQSEKVDYLQNFGEKVVLVQCNSDQGHFVIW